MMTPSYALIRAIITFVLLLTCFPSPHNRQRRGFLSCRLQNQKVAPTTIKKFRATLLKCHKPCDFMNSWKWLFPHKSWDLIDFYPFSLDWHPHCLRRIKVLPNLNSNRLRRSIGDQEMSINLQKTRTSFAFAALLQVGRFIFEPGVSVRADSQARDETEDVANVTIHRISGPKVRQRDA